MSGYRRRGALIAALLGFFIVMLDTTVVNVALSGIGADLGAAVTSLQWVVDAYALTFAALQLSAGSACDRVGARSVHLLGLVVFGLLSVACALAPTGGVLIASRARQGVGAATVPASLAILSLIHDRPADRARAIGLWGGAGGIAAAVGPVAGGLLVTWTGWRFVFWVNLPLIAITAWLTARCVPSPTMHSVRLRGGSDLPGQVLSVVGLAAATYGVITAGESGWSLSVVASVLVGLVLLMVFVMVERIVSRPMLPTAVFSRPRFAVAATVGFTLNTGFFGQLFVLALFLQRYLGYEPWLAGLALAPQACSAIVASPLGGRLLRARSHYCLDAVPGRCGADLPGRFRYRADHACGDRRCCGLRTDGLPRSRWKRCQRGEADRQRRRRGGPGQHDRRGRCPHRLPPGGCRRLGRLRRGRSPGRRRLCHRLRAARHS